MAAGRAARLFYKSVEGMRGYFYYLAGRRGKE